MKTTKIVILILAIAAMLYILVPGLSWSEDGVAPFKANQRVTTRSFVSHARCTRISPRMPFRPSRAKVLLTSEGPPVHLWLPNCFDCF